MQNGVVGATIPSIDAASFARRLAAAGAPEVDAPVLQRLLVHHAALAVGNVHLSLVGPGAVGELVERHYAESLAGLPWIREPGVARVLDVGSGAGFPGWILAAAAPGPAFTLLDSHGRKAAFLRESAAAAGVALDVVALRLRELAARQRRAGDTAPFDRILSRAVRWERADWSAARALLAPGGAVVLWTTRAENGPPAAGWCLRESLSLAGETRILARYEREAGARDAGDQEAEAR